MTVLLMIAAQAADPPPASVSFDLARVRAAGEEPSFPARRTCDGATDDGAIVVCGKRRDFRLPLPVEHDATDPDAHLPGDVPAASAALVPRGRCGIFAGERRCGKAEALRYGYGGGRDPITFFSRLGEKLVDPDAE